MKTSTQWASSGVAFPEPIYVSRPLLPDMEQLIAQVNASNNVAKPVSPELKSMIDQSKAMDFSVADRAPADELNRIIWQTVKGPGSVMPQTPRGPQIQGAKPKVHDDDDDDDRDKKGK